MKKLASKNLVLVGFKHGTWSNITLYIEPVIANETAESGKQCSISKVSQKHLVKNKSKCQYENREELLSSNLKFLANFIKKLQSRNSLQTRLIMMEEKASVK